MKDVKNTEQEKERVSTFTFERAQRFAHLKELMSYHDNKYINMLASSELNITTFKYSFCYECSAFQK